MRLNHVQREKMTKTEICREYKKRFPRLENRTLAKKLHGDNPKVFASVENARKVVRYLVGASGTRDRAKRIADRACMTDAALEKLMDEQMPKTCEEPLLPYNLVAKKVLAIADIHVPYHDEAALKTMIRKTADNGYDAILLNGDCVDCYHAGSKFIRDPRLPRLAEEREILWKLLALLRKVYGCRIVYKVGNHEERLENYLKTSAPEIYDCEEFRFPKLYAHEGVEFVDNKRPITYGKLNIFHGHEFGKGLSSPVNPARTLFLKTMTTALCGHLHRPSEHPEPMYGGRIVTCWSLGCMCSLTPAYLPINKWIHGYGEIEMDSRNDFHFVNHRIIDGRVF